MDHIQCSTHCNPQVLSRIAAQPADFQPGRVHRVSCPCPPHPGWDFAYLTAELREVSVGQLPEFLEVPQERCSAVQHISHSPQFCIVCKVAECAFCPRACMRWGRGLGRGQGGQGRRHREQCKAKEYPTAKFYGRKVRSAGSIPQCG